MIPSLRQQFNQRFTPEKYQKFLSLVEQRGGVPPRFRHNESPLFLPEDRAHDLGATGLELIRQLSTREYFKLSEQTLPADFRVAGDEGRPMFLQVDFGIDLEGKWKLVEIQGFPSLYAYQPLLAECYRDAYEIEGLRHLPGHLSAERYRELLCRAILGDAHPEEVVLLEIDPKNQKTYCDFVVTEQLCGIRTVDITDVRQSGRELYYEHDGKRHTIRRIYNRAIVDELQRRDVELQFDLTADLDVEWAGHPNWFFRISKFSLPYLKHESVPETYFLRDAPSINDPENWVLKPLFSFAGLGVVVAPSMEHIQAADPDRYILQRRIEFAAPMATPYGPTKCELRAMYLWIEEQPEFVNIIVRTGRGTQMGVDFNKGLEWVGASAVFLQ